MSLFVSGEFTSHSGLKLPFKIDCDALSQEDYTCLAALVANSEAIPKFYRVIGVPEGGLRFAVELQKYAVDSGEYALIVDDVLTTGVSMEEERKKLRVPAQRIMGVVAFARGPCPRWILPIFALNMTFWDPAAKFYGK